MAAVAKQPIPSLFFIFIYAFVSVFMISLWLLAAAVKTKLAAPQITPTWVDLEDGRILVNTAEGRLKQKTYQEMIG